MPRMYSPVSRHVELASARYGERTLTGEGAGTAQEETIAPRKMKAFPGASRP